MAEVPSAGRIYAALVDIMQARYNVKIDYVFSDGRTGLFSDHLVAEKKQSETNIGGQNHE